MRAMLTAAAAAALAVVLAGCGSFDPLDKLQELDIMGSSKTPLPGERQPVFPQGVPGVPQGVPPDLVKGYQPPPEAPPPVVEAKPVRPKPKKTAAAPAAPRRPQPRNSNSNSNSNSSSTAASRAGAAQRTTTQPVNQSAGGTQTMPGAQPTWPTNAPPAPGPWAGPQR